MTENPRKSALNRVVTSHPRIFGENRFVYPVVSRRSRGLSVGVNLNPDKICNFDCVYCQVDRTASPPYRTVDFDRLKAELRALLEEARSGEIFRGELFRDIPDAFKRINDIAFSGDGEPTTYPRFREAVEYAASIKTELGLGEVKIIVLTNSTRFHRPEVQAAFDVMHKNNGEIWAKLDAGTATYYDRIDRTRVSFDTVTRNLSEAATRWPLVIQSLFMRLGGELPPPGEISAYTEVLGNILSNGGALKLVQVHTVARPPAEDEVTPLSDAEVDAIADTVRKRLVDVPVETYYAPRSS